MTPLSLVANTSNKRADRLGDAYAWLVGQTEIWFERKATVAQIPLRNAAVRSLAKPTILLNYVVLLVQYFADELTWLKSNLSRHSDTTPNASR